ncbi:MAG: hypothetical protein AB1714_19385 [Acidobacteriota bacterium]
MRSVSSVCIACLALLGFVGGLQAAPVVFEGVRVRYQKADGKRRMEEKKAKLAFDDEKSLLTLDAPSALSILYASVQRVVHEITRRSAGGAMGSTRTVKDYWCLFDVKSEDGSSRSYLIATDEKSAPPVIEKMKAVFGERFVVPAFPEKPDEIKEDLPKATNKCGLSVDQKSSPVPEIVPGKALVVVVFPDYDGRMLSAEFKLRVAEKILGVNREGTYTFFHLDPGQVLLASEGTSNTYGMTITLEPGKDYYFMQNMFESKQVYNQQFLGAMTRQSKELVMFEIGGANYSSCKE